MSVIRNSHRLVSVTSLSESLCHGIVRRLFLELEAFCCHPAPQLKKLDRSKIDTVLMNQVMLIAQRYNKRNVVAKKIHSIFASLIFPITGDYWSTLEGNVEVHHGFNLANDKLHVVSFLIDIKRPHRSRLETQFRIGFTRHVIERLIYRFKPADLGTLLVVVMRLLNSTLQYGTKEELRQGEGLWLYFEDVGGFYLELDRLAPSDLALITFVDSEKFSTEQKLASKQHILFLSEIENDKVRDNIKHYLDCLRHLKSDANMIVPSNHRLAG